MELEAKISPEVNELSKKVDSVEKKVEELFKKKHKNMLFESEIQLLTMQLATYRKDAFLIEKGNERNEKCFKYLDDLGYDLLYLELIKYNLFKIFLKCKEVL